MTFLADGNARISPSRSAIELDASGNGLAPTLPIAIDAGR